MKRKQNKKSLQNLKPFKKGFDPKRNIKGTPKLPDLKEAIAKVLSETQGGKEALEAVLLALRNKAIKGDVRAAEVLLDRAFGKAQQTNINIEHKLGKDLEDETYE